MGPDAGTGRTGDGAGAHVVDEAPRAPVRLARRGQRRARWPPTSVSRLGVISIGAAAAVADATTGDWTSSVPTGPLIATTLGREAVPATGARRANLWSCGSPSGPTSARP